jgi:ferrous iron transport protein A
MSARPIDSVPSVSLASLHKGARGTVVCVQNDTQSLGEEAESTLGRRLLELGFVAGEQVEVVGEVWPGGDPLAVRIANTTFAIRRREAASVMVSLAPG